MNEGEKKFDGEDVDFGKPPEQDVNLLRAENLELLKRRADLPGNEERQRYLDVNNKLDQLEQSNNRIELAKSEYTKEMESTDPTNLGNDIGPETRDFIDQDMDKNEVKGITSFMFLFITDEQYRTKFDSSVIIEPAVKFDGLTPADLRVNGISREGSTLSCRVNGSEVIISGRALTEVGGFIERASLPKEPEPEYKQYDQVLYTKEDLEELSEVNLGAFSQDIEALRSRAKEGIATRNLAHPLFVIDISYPQEEAVTSVDLFSDTDVDFAQDIIKGSTNEPNVYLLDGDRYIT